MSSELIGGIGFGIMLLFMFLGLPIWICMFLVGAAGITVLGNLHQAWNVVATCAHNVASDYTFATLPVFLLIGEFADISGMMNESYNALNTLVGKLRGGLAMASILGAGAFSCISGSSMACSAIMTRVALPQLIDRKYDPELAAGALAAGGTLGNLIPPGTVLIIYALLTDVSLGKLFVACYIPGFLLAFMYLVQIYIQCTLKPSLGPGASSSTWKAKLLSTKDLSPVLVSLIVILGGIQFGVFTPNEAASVCTVFIFIYAVVRRTVTGQNLLGAFKNTLVSTGMVFAIIISSQIFTVFSALSKLPQALSVWLMEFHLSGLGLVILIMVIYAILGIPLNVISVMLLTMPIFLPLLVAFKVDLLWFGILTITQCELANLSPPVGVNLFIVAQMGKPYGISMGTVFKGSIPFCVTCLVFIIVLIAFPQISLFMVSQMK